MDKIKAKFNGVKQNFWLRRAKVIFAGLMIFSFAGSALAATPQVNTAKITGKNTVVVVYSEPVNTEPGLYSGIGGSLSGRSVTALSGSGTNTITLTLSGQTLPTGASGDLNIGYGVRSVADNSNAASSTITAIDGQAPTFSSLGLSTTSLNPGNSLAQIGDTINLTFSSSEQVLAPVVTILGHSVNVSGSGNGPFTASYTLSSGDTVGQVSALIGITDLAGNNSQQIPVSLNLTGATPSVSSVTPQTSTQTQTQSALKITQVAAVTDPSPTATPSYTFSSTGAGTINYAGDCTSTTKTAVAGSNTVTFSTLSDGVHNNCALWVSDSTGNVSNTLFVSGFTVGNSTAAAVAAPQSAVVSGGYKFTKLLKKGMSGEEVLQLQNRLAADGYLKVAPNGYFGPATEAAVKAFQKDHGLDQFGYVGPGTRAELNK